MNKESITQNYFNHKKTGRIHSEKEESIYEHKIILKKLNYNLKNNNLFSHNQKFTNSITVINRQNFLTSRFFYLTKVETENIIYANQSQDYFIDYDSDDEGVGNSKWSINSTPEVSWLKLDPNTGFVPKGLKGFAAS